MNSRDDTIAALATPVGTSAIAFIRISGDDTKKITATLFGDPPPLRTASRREYRGSDGVLLDDVLITVFAGPASYTGEDTLEISCHGNPFIARKILDDLYLRGCRPAEPGEFTQRAFLNGKMDLSQAEAVMDLINARSESALAAAHHQLKGALGRQLQALVDGLLAALARVEAYIDFPEEDLPAEDSAIVAAEIENVLRGTRRLLATEQAGAWLREGIATVILGEPNAGKSSLLNRMVGRDRSLVSPLPGTTRDFVEERIGLGRHWIRLIDTAGLNPTPEPLEKLGIEKTIEQGENADLFLVVVDTTRKSPTLPDTLAGRMHPKNTVVVLNKCDLTVSNPPAEAFPGFITHPVSALTGHGIEALETSLTRLADQFQETLGDEFVSINARHALALNEVKAALEDALANLASGGPVELLASDLRTALDGVGQISGKVDNERMLDQLFLTFCIGK